VFQLLHQVALADNTRSRSGILKNPGCFTNRPIPPTTRKVKHDVSVKARGGHLRKPLASAG